MWQGARRASWDRTEGGNRLPLRKQLGLSHILLPSFPSFEQVPVGHVWTICGASC